MPLQQPGRLILREAQKLMVIMMQPCWFLLRKYFTKIRGIEATLLLQKKIKKPSRYLFLFFFNTGLTGLEPATSAVTGRCSNQLNYKPNKFCCALIMPDHLEFCNKNKKDFYLKSWRVCHPVYNGLHLELRQTILFTPSFKMLVTILYGFFNVKLLLKFTNLT